MKHSIAIPVLMAAGLAVSGGAQSPSTAVPARPAPAPAAAAAPAPGGKIAVIAFQIAVSDTNEFQRDFAALQKKWEPKRQELRKLNDDVEASTKALQTQGATLSDAERANRAKSIDDKKKQLDRSAEDAQNDFQQEIQNLFAGTASKVNDVLSAYAEQNGYSVVLNVGDQQPAVLYAVPSMDITKAVVDAYNVKSGVPAPPQTAPAPASTMPTAPKPAAPRPAAPKGPSGK